MIIAILKGVCADIPKQQQQRGRKMSKEYLEALERVGDNLEHHYLENIKDFNILKQSLQRLESIDNAEPSEALECLDKLEQDIKDRVILAEDRQLKLCAVIKQALLKAQEPKQYLKWEDLEFKKKQQVMDVLLNGKPYILYFYKLSTQNEVTIFSIDMHIVTLSSNYTEDVQFFNDLKLERVEE